MFHHQRMQRRLINRGLDSCPLLAGEDCGDTGVDSLNRRALLPGSRCCTRIRCPLAS